MTELRKQTENHNGTMVEIKILRQQGYKTKIMTEERLHKIVEREETVYSSWISGQRQRTKTVEHRDNWCFQR